LRLVFVTQQVDPGHPALAATVPMLRALAGQVDEVVVLADRALPEVLPANCRVRSFGSGMRAGRGAKFESALAAELARRPKPAAWSPTCARSTRFWQRRSRVHSA
jgi:hypothetical protein